MVELIQEQRHFLKLFIQTTSAQRKGQPEVKFIFKPDWTKS